MSDLLLLLALVAFVGSIALLFKTRARKNSGDNTGLWFAVFVSSVIMIACNGNKPGGEDGDTVVTTDTVLSTDKYTIYITKKDIDSIKDDSPDSVNVVMTQREYTGMQLFMMNCNKCHPAGNAGIGPSLNDKPLPDFLIHFQIRQGLGDMPAFKEEELSKEEVQKIVLFVRSMRKNYKATHD